MINYSKIITSIKNKKESIPFDYCVIDDFFDLEVARNLELEFPNYDSNNWFVYDNLLENKKALNDWNQFPPLKYKIISILNSKKMINIIEKFTNVKLHPDMGLHGGGWHIHGAGGNLNPHLDYSIHPKNGLQRKINLIIYL